VESVDRGADGCFALDLVIRNPLDEVLDDARWYVCVPMSTLGLAPGRRVRVETLGGTELSTGGVMLRTADGTEEHPVPEGEPAVVELQAYRGSLFPIFHGLQVAAVPSFDCAYGVAETCGTVTRATSVTAGGGDFDVVEMQYGDRTTLTGANEAELTVALAHAEERIVLDPDCAEGPDALGLDLEVAALYIEPDAG